jgi:hypothetical protein
VGRAHSRLDLENRRYELASRIIDMLDRDIPADSDATLRIDLAPADAPQKVTSGEEKDGWNVAFFSDPWLSISTALADGTRVSLELCEKLRVRQRWARSASGRQKHKLKKRSILVATLLLKHKQALAGGQAPRAAETVRLPPQVVCKALELSPKGGYLRVLTQETWDAGAQKGLFDASQLIAMMFLSLYQAMRAPSKRKAAPPADQA